MIRRWFRAVAVTWMSGRPSSTPPSGGRARARLRLEAVEDRTLASAVAVEPPDPLEGRVAIVDPSATEQSPDRSALPPADLGSDLPPTDAAPVMGDAPVVADQFEMTAAFPTVLRQQDTFNPRLIGEADASEEPGPRSNGARTGSRSTATATPPPTSDVANPTNSVGTPATAERSAPPPAAPPAEAARNDPSPTETSVRRAVRLVTSSRAGVPEPVAQRVRPAGTVRTPPVATPTGALADGVLLHRFATNRDQAAFTALVQRYGDMVSRTCQRVLGDFHAAQDASQATFVVLARRAGMLDRTTPIGGWLYKVAYHLALRARGMAARQRLGDGNATDDWPAPPVGDGTPDLDRQEMVQVLREELLGLPEKYRAPLTLCYIDGRTHADAAREIGLPRGSMAKRVGEGLDHLRERLIHRGLDVLG